MYFPVSALLIEFMILSIVNREDSYGYEIIQTIKPQKYNPFSVEPLVAYVLARENEIKTVRIILSAKANNLPEDSIRERVREMYV